MKKIKKQVELTAVFEPATEGGYTVTIPSLPGCLTEGDTFEEALANIQEAAELYLEVASDKKLLPDLNQSSRSIVAPVQVSF